MTKEEKKLIYDSKVQKLVEDIKAIMDMPIAKPEQSVKIMSRLREECIFAKNSYIKKFEGNDHLVTIDPYADEVKPELEEGDEEGSGDDQYCRIYANSFGTFNAEEFFKKDKTIVWLLKEPYVKHGDLQNLRDRNIMFLGGRNQSQEYYNEGWNVIKQLSANDGNPTIANLIRISKVILEKQGVSLNGTEEEIMTQVMDYICIIEINPFPGLAFNDNWRSNDSRLKKWGRINIPLLKELCAFYAPDIIISGGIHDCIHNIRSYQTDLIKSIKEEKLLNNLGYSPDKRCLNNKADFIVNDDCKRSHIIPTIQGTVFVQASHPLSYSEGRAKDDGQRIKQWLESRNKTGV